LTDPSNRFKPGVTQEQVATAADIVRRQLQTFARELVSSLQYYQNQPDSLGIGDHRDHGGTSLFAGLAVELQRLIGVSVRVGDPFERVKPARGVAVDESQRSLRRLSAWRSRIELRDRSDATVNLLLKTRNVPGAQLPTLRCWSESRVSPSL